jgi:hypothetical protein
MSREEGADLRAQSVFISYAHEDKVFVRQLADELTRAGFLVHFDQHIEGGARWLGFIKEHIAAANAVLFVVSPEFNESVICGEEIAQAIELEKAYIPICYRAEPTDLRLGERQFVLVDPGEDSLAKLSDGLVKILSLPSWNRDHAVDARCLSLEHHG